MNNYYDNVRTYISNAIYNISFFNGKQINSKTLDDMIDNIAKYIIENWR